MKESLIDQEVRIRMLEELNKRIETTFDKIYNKFNRIESKIDSHFLWMIGFILVSIITPVFLHAIKLL
jgi:hypothetical protein